MTSIYGKAFNNCLEEYLLFIVTLFPNNVDIRTAYNSLLNTKKMNPTLVVKFWYGYVVAKYNDPIQKGDYEYFVNKEYTQDIMVTSTDEKITQQIIQGIENMRKYIIEMEVSDKEKWIQYMKQLNNLSILYFNSKQK
jgi:hypothetical protein